MRNVKNKLVKKIAALALAVAGIGFTTSNTFAQVAAQPVAQVAADYQPRSMADLQQLAAPVALYPDALLAQVFAASTYPDQVVAAAQYLRNGGDPNQAANNGWDPSVQGLMMAPNALNQLAGNVDWMNQLGNAFLNQQQDMMNAVQVLRQQAQAAGNLVTTPQQEVVAQDNCIQILPADPQVIYVPVYDPGIVYFRQCGITFCPGISVGVWLHDDFDWFDHRIYFGNWGFNRPWWNRAGGRIGFDYIHNHPGIFVRNAGSRATAWVHPVRRSAPVAFRAPEINRRGTLPERGTKEIHRGAAGPAHPAVIHRGGAGVSHGGGAVHTRTVRTTTTRTVTTRGHRK